MRRAFANKIVRKKASGAAFVIAYRPAAVLVDELDQTAQTVAPLCGLAELTLSTYELPESEIAGHWMKIAIVVE
jgi:hypothetical protein